MSTAQYRRRQNSLRLRGYDYGEPNAYFITLVTWQREMIFGEIKDDEMVLSELGKIVRSEWIRTPHIRKEIELGTYVIMPNHFHAIVIINDVDTVGATGWSPLQHRSGSKPKSLGALVAGFKSSVTKRINQLRKTPGLPVWQRN